MVEVFKTNVTASADARKMERLAARSFPGLCFQFRPGGLRQDLSYRFSCGRFRKSDRPVPRAAICLLRSFITKHIYAIPVHRDPGARENNLKNVSLRIPRNSITVFTGVSGSGKSSIAFETIGAEAQRQLNETFTTFVQNFLPRAKKPEADAIENISTAIIINQQRLGGNSRSTVGTITDIYSLIRLLYSRVGKPHAGYSNAFSFNDPAGMCPACNGLGRKSGSEPRKTFRQITFLEGRWHYISCICGG